MLFSLRKVHFEFQNLLIGCSLRPALAQRLARVSLNFCVVGKRSTILRKDIHGDGHQSREMYSCILSASIIHQRKIMVTRYPVHWLSRFEPFFGVTRRQQKITVSARKNCFAAAANRHRYRETRNSLLSDDLFAKAFPICTHHIYLIALFGYELLTLDVSIILKLCGGANTWLTYGRIGSYFFTNKNCLSNDL